jgi:hypothetical protein
MGLVSDVSITLLRSQRILVIAGAISAIFFMLVSFYKPFSSYFTYAFGIDINDTGMPLVFLMFSVAALALVYLQSGRVGDSARQDSIAIELLIKEVQSIQVDSQSHMKKINERLEVFESSKGLSADEKEKIITGVIGQVNNDVVTSIFSREADRFKDSLLASLSLERLASSSKAIVERLNREIADLRLRSNINLIIGMAITIVGVYLLWKTVEMIDTSVLLRQLASEGQESTPKFIKNLFLPLVPRVLLVVFVEVFAYFFLSLYKSGLSEIKYFQNELTNIESKLAAVEFSYMTKNEEGIKLAVESLSKTERNFILEKGQATVELEKAKSESELTRNIIKTIPSFFKKAGK